MLGIETRVKECETPAGELTEAHIHATQPLVLKGLVKHWPLKQEADNSSDAAVAYLKSFYNGKPAFAYFGDQTIAGNYSYTDDVSSLNYESKPAAIDEVLDLITAHINTPKPPSFYIASNVIEANFPSMSEVNPLHIPVAQKEFATEPPIPSIWIGNKSVARCHYDASDNIACCVAGKRRFIVFPPDQISNLYPGPLAPTPGGQAITMVDFHNPDFDKYPRFKDALAHAQIAELEPGDAIFIPSMWWHQVEGLNDFNIMINYWWSDAEKFMGSAMNVLLHAMLSLRDKPEHEKQAWKHVFEYYIFGDSNQARAHLPEQAHGFLAQMDPMLSRQLRTLLINKLNR